MSMKTSDSHPLPDDQSFPEETVTELPSEESVGWEFSSQKTRKESRGRGICAKAPVRTELGTP